MPLSQATLQPLTPVSRWLPPAIFAVLILVATSWPDLDLGQFPTRFDKLGHFGMYGTFGVLVQRAASQPRAYRTVAVSWVALALFAAVDEWHQSFISGRSAGMGDWSADVAGALVGLLVARHFLPSTPVRPDARL